MGLSIEGLARRFTRAVQREANALEVLGKIVEVEQDGVTSFRVLDDVNKVYVQLHGGDEKDIYEAYNVSGVKPRDGMRVILRVTEGEYEIIRQAPKSATELYGEFAPALSGTEQIGELSYAVWPGRNLAPGRGGVVSTDQPLVIRIEPHWYEWHGQYKLWPGGTLDMSAYLPTTTDQWWWAWVCIDPSTDEPLAVTGEEVAGMTLLTDSKLAEIGATLSGLHPV